MVSISFQGKGNILKMLETRVVPNGNAAIERTNGFAHGMTHSGAEVKETIMKEIKNGNIDFVQGAEDALFRQNIKGSELEKMLAVAEKHPKIYDVYDGREKGYINVIRKVEEKAGKSTARIQTFDSNTGKLRGTDRRINDNYSIYSDPNNGTITLQYFTKVPNKDGYNLNRVYVETAPKTYSDVKAFFEAQKNLHL